MTESKNSRMQYDAWLHWNVTYRCTLDCTYCFFHGSAYHGQPNDSGHGSEHHGQAIDSGHGGEPHAQAISSGHDGGALSIDIPALIKALDRSGRTFRISFTGGEPFLVPNLVEACTEITKKHCISLLTNLVTGDIRDLAGCIDPDRVISIIASLHIKELKHRGLLELYSEHYTILKSANFPIVAAQVAYPPLLSEIEDYLDYFDSRDIQVTFVPFEGRYDGRHYPEAYTPHELRVFGLDQADFAVFKSRGIACNAGYNAGVVSPTGRIKPCFQSGETMGNIYESVTFKDTMTACTHDRCTCPLYAYDPYLFEQTLS